ncbi:hypothetical protein, partial [Culicoidibacter larvae]|uniref:hypothetical protein n=1 Tax=Culicoidibacter larvae TaxID=2579976 RepID=UPI001A7E051A
CILVLGHKFSSFRYCEICPSFVGLTIFGQTAVFNELVNKKRQHYDTVFSSFWYLLVLRYVNKPFLAVSSAVPLLCAELLLT